MTESEYIDATNLVRIRLIQTILRGILPHGVVGKVMHADLTSALQSWAQSLTAVIKTKEPEVGSMTYTFETEIPPLSVYKENLERVKKLDHTLSVIEQLAQNASISPLDTYAFIAMHTRNARKSEAA
jgi:hypothetical protein